MLSYTGRRNLFGTLTQNTTTTNLTTADTLINAGEKRILGMHQWNFLQTSATKTSSIGTQTYKIPQRIGKLESLTYTVGGVTYTPRKITSEKEWNTINADGVSGDYPTSYYQRDEDVLLSPKPSSVGTITYYGRAVAKDLTIADYTTGSVVSIANGGTAVVGTGTTWTTQMADRFIRITDTTTANTGDGYWYPIASVESTTALTLAKPYAGTAISAGTAGYTIGQMSLLPEEYHELPVYDAVKVYFASIQPDYSKFQFYDKMFKEMYNQMLFDYSVQTGDTTLSAEVIDYN